MTRCSLIPKHIETLVKSTRVLVVDDDYYMRKVIRSLLQVSGIKTFYEAPNGLEGIEAIITLNPDVVILDWNMPDINGSADHHADRPCRARNRGRGGAARRQRVPVQAGFRQDLV
jgi:CheY-like chemotaxis protein